MANGGPSTAAASAGGPRAAPPPIQNERVEQKRDLASWWKNFKRSDKKAPEQEAHTQGIFGIPLQNSIRYANVAISLFDDEGQSYIYGYVPIVVAKCGVFLKEKATDVEGIFRLAGSEKRIKELKAAFDSPDRYGKGLDWTGYTVHDAANILRRYFNQLPEPIIPLEFYERFRTPLKNHQAQAVGIIEAQSPSVGDFDQDEAIRIFQSLITELPPLNRQLLLYILDLLAVFASKSDMNKMTTPNLAAIFQPGILSHPQHDMAPQEYRLSQDVLIFLIENQDSFLIGMSGTAADPETVRDVQSGTPVRSPSTPTTPTRGKTILGRSSSGASAGADSVRKWGGVRRNVSVSSKQSRQSELGPTPVASGVTSPITPSSGGGIGRSNTVPSRRSATASPRFPRDKHSDPSTPTPGMLSTPPESAEYPSGSMENTPIASRGPGFPVVAPPQIIRSSSNEATTTLGSAKSVDSSDTARALTPEKQRSLAPGNETNDHPAQRSVSNTSSALSTGGGGFLGIFKQSPGSDNEGRKPNKLQKKRLPGTSLSSAQSSSQSLDHNSPIDAAQQPQTDGPPVMPATPQRNPTDATLRPTASPPQSFHSATDLSDADLGGDEQQGGDLPQKKRNRWRFSRSQNKMDPPPVPGTFEHQVGTMAPKEQASRSTIGSTGQPRQSLNEAAPPALAATGTDPVIASPAAPAQGINPSNSDPVFSDSEREKKGPMSWIRGKIQERKEKDAEKRTRTPDRNRGERHSRHASKQDLRMPSESTPAMPVRGKSVEANRAVSGSSNVEDHQVQHSEQQRSVSGQSVMESQTQQPVEPVAVGAEPAVTQPPTSIAQPEAPAAAQPTAPVPAVQEKAEQAAPVPTVPTGPESAAQTTETAPAETIKTTEATEPIVPSESTLPTANGDAPTPTTAQ